MVAYHEVGHALVAALTPNADPVQKVSIVPRGFGALGYTLQTPTEERFLLTYDELIAKVDVLLGGRAAEQIIYGQVSTGAANDLTKATDIVKKDDYRVRLQREVQERGADAAAGTASWARGPSRR